jgi:hypothetical protein
MAWLLVIGCSGFICETSFRWRWWWEWWITFLWSELKSVVRDKIIYLRVLALPKHIDRSILYHWFMSRWEQKVSLRIASLYLLLLLEFQSEQVYCLPLLSLIASLIHKKAHFVLNLTHVIFPFTCTNQRLLFVAIARCLPRSITKLDEV